MLKKIGVVALTLTLTASLVLPAYARRYYSYGPRCYPRYGYGYGYGAAGAGAGIAVGLIAGLLIGAAIANSTHAEKGMLDAAGRANQYENYVIAMDYYNANSPRHVVVKPKAQWIEWRQQNNLEYLP